MLTNAYLLAKIGADTAENEQHFAENLPIGRRVADRGSATVEALLRPERTPTAALPHPIRLRTPTVHRRARRALGSANSVG